jgi:alanine racemase
VGITQKIVLMRGVYHQTELALANELKLDLVIHQKDQLNLLSNQTHWIKINTGMNRLGFTPDEIPEVYSKLKNNDLILMTHFSNAEELDNPITSKQIESFNKITKDYSCPKSLANSAGILNWKESHQNWIRPGLFLYTGLKSVMTWQSQLIAIRYQKKGDAIGYNGAYICEENMPIGIVGVGYGDGYPRHAKNGTPVLINDVEVPLSGRVSMDMLAVDLRNVSSAKIGDKVTLWGEGLPVEKIAKYTATNAYEFLCNARLRGK